MHGIEHCIRNCRTLCLKTARRPDLPVIGSNASRRAACSLRMGLSARNGLSLARNEFRLRGFRHEVKVPGLLLRFRIRRPHRPVRLQLRSQFRFAPVSAVSLLSARCGVTAELCRLRFQLPLPLGCVTSLRIERFCWSRCLPAHLPGPARSPFAPRSHFLLLGLAPDHRSRSATIP
jgi:hypothetical protein